jgi:hypothetical protein
MAVSDESSSDAGETRPFFDIPIDEATGASEATAAPAPVMFGTAGPQAVQIGSLNAAGQPTQMMGEVSSMEGMFAFQGMDVPAKAKFAWGQFFLGMFLPFLVFFVLAVLAEAMEPEYEDWPDFSRVEEVTVSPDEDGYYMVNVVKNETENINFWFSLSTGETETSVSLYYDVYEDSFSPRVGQKGAVVQGSYNESSEEYTEEEIGEYFPSNQSIWFKPNPASEENHTFEVYYYDAIAENAWLEKQNRGGNLIEAIFCFGGPVAFIGAIAAAFYKGNKALGYGLLSSIPMAFIVGPVMFLLLLMMYGF